MIGGPFLPPDQRAALNASLGYDEPLVSRFWHYLKGLPTGDFGVSYRTNDGAIHGVLAALPNTLILVITAMAISCVAGLALALFSIRWRERLGDRIIRRTIGILQGTPEFWLGLMLILVFSVGLQWLPSYGFFGGPSLVLPAVALASPIVPVFFRLFRGQLLDVLRGDFVEGMRARGLSEPVIVYNHGLRNIVGRGATLMALQLGNLIAGDLIIEVIFSWPGIGNLAFSAVQARDFAVVQAIIVVVAAIYVLLNIAADLVLVVSDPRVRSVAS
ncbi:peptide ABC transporter permease [Amycolatopsis acidiphila]|nr:peptide ABC transporter permease [Amycolatopsis acidiphila]